MKIAEINCETGETIVREMTKEELEISERDAKFFSDREKAAAEADAEIDAAKVAVYEKLVELGITPELIEVIKKITPKGKKPMGVFLCPKLFREFI